MFQFFGSERKHAHAHTWRTALCGRSDRMVHRIVKHTANAFTFAFQITTSRLAPSWLYNLANQAHSKSRTVRATWRHQRSQWAAFGLAQAILTQARAIFTRNLCVCLTQGEVGCLVFCVCCRDHGDCLVLVCSVAIPATVFPSCLCDLAALVSRKVSW